MSGKKSKQIAQYFGIDSKFVKSVEQILKGEKIQARIPFELEIN